MREYKLLISCVLVFLFQLPTGNSLKCGVCSTVFGNDNCADPAKVSNVEDCNTKREHVCRTLQYYDKEVKKVQFARGCVEEKDRSGNDACSATRLSFYAQIVDCKTCKTDLCNANQGLGMKKINDQQTYFTSTPSPQTDKTSAVHSSICIVTSCIFLSFFKIYFL